MGNSSNPDDKSKGDVAKKLVATNLDRLRTIIDDREALAKDDRTLQEEAKGIEAFLIRLSKSLGTDIFRSPRLTLTVKAVTRYIVDPERWEDFYKWAVKTNNMHVLFKRASGAPFDDMIKAGSGVPDMVTMEDYDKASCRRTGK